MVDVFISYKSDRREAAAHLAKILECYGYTVWYDYSLIKGRDFAAQIDTKIREAKAVIVLWCSLSVRSEWVADEAALAAKLGILVPAKIEPCELRVDFARKDYLDLTRWGGAPRDHALDALLAALKQKVGRAPQQDFEAIAEYDKVWRRFGAPSLKAFALGAPVRFGLEPSGSPEPSTLRAVELKWERRKKGRWGDFKFTPSDRVFIAALIASVAVVVVWQMVYVGEKSRRAAVLMPPEKPAPALPQSPVGQPSVSEKGAAFPLPKDMPPAEITRPDPASAILQTPLQLQTCDGVFVSVAQPESRLCVKPGSGASFKDCPDCPEMAVAPSGSFTMGSPEGEEGRSLDEGPQHKVTITTPFAVGRTHITRGQFATFVKATGHRINGGCDAWTGSEWKENKNASWRSPGFDQDDSHPVVCVNWNDAKAYVAWLAETTGKPYRLLSEAEAEYAARGVTVAGKQPRYFFGDDAKDLCRYANGADETAKTKFAAWTVAPCYDGYVFTAPSMSFKPNAFGLYDMHGNAWSWVEDCYHGSYAGAPADGSAWISRDCDKRVIRGGSWFYYSLVLRSAFRDGDSADYRNYNIGFRVARTISP